MLPLLTYLTGVRAIAAARLRISSVGTEVTAPTNFAPGRSQDGSVNVFQRVDGDFRRAVSGGVTHAVLLQLSRDIYAHFTLICILGDHAPQRVNLPQNPFGNCDDELAFEGNCTQSFPAAREYLDAQVFLKLDDRLQYSWLRGMQNLGDSRQLEVLPDRLPYEAELAQVHGAVLQ